LQKGLSGWPKFEHWEFIDSLDTLRTTLRKICLNTWNTEYRLFLKNTVNIDVYGFLKISVEIRNLLLIAGTTQAFLTWYGERSEQISKLGVWGAL